MSSNVSILKLPIFSLVGLKTNTFTMVCLLCRTRCLPVGHQAVSGAERLGHSTGKLSYCYPNGGDRKVGLLAALCQHWSSFFLLHWRIVLCGVESGETEASSAEEQLAEG